MVDDDRRLLLGHFVTLVGLNAEFGVGIFSLTRNSRIVGWLGENDGQIFGCLYELAGKDVSA